MTSVLSRLLTSLFFCAVVSVEAAAQRYLYEDQTEIGHFGGALIVGDLIPASESTPLSDPSQYSGAPIAGMRAADGTTFGLRLTRNMSPRITGEVTWAYTFSKLERRTPDGEEVRHDKVGIVQYGVSLFYHPVWLADERVGPFLQIGGGGVSWRPANGFRDWERPVSTQRTASLALFAGAGAIFYATEDLVFRGGYQATFTEVDRDRLFGLDEPFPTIGSKSLVAHRLTIGFGLRLFDTDL